MKNIAIIGQGSAGIQSLCHFLAWLPEDWTVTSICDPNIPIIGIGESTNPTFTVTLQNGLDFYFSQDTFSELDATLKFGTKYKNWRKNDFTNPLVGNSPIAIHINTFKLKEFAIPRLRKIWRNKFKEVYGNVSSIYNDTDSAVAIINNESYMFDYIIDCSGFPKTFNEEFEVVKPFLNHGFVYNKEPICKNGFEELYTGHIATKDGWMFEVPLSSRTSYGYLFNTNITEIDKAKENFKEQINFIGDEFNPVSFSFKSFYIKKIISNRIIKNGNSAVFFEPLFANSLFVYDCINKIVFDYIQNKYDEEVCNSTFYSLIQNVENVIAFHYLGGSVFDTDFWEYAKNTSKEKIDNMKDFKEISSKIKFLNDRRIISSDISWIFLPQFLRQMDKNFEYYIFSSKEYDE